MRNGLEWTSNVLLEPVYARRAIVLGTVDAPRLESSVLKSGNSTEGTPILLCPGNPESWLKLPNRGPFAVRARPADGKARGFPGQTPKSVRSLDTVDRDGEGPGYQLVGHCHPPVVAERHVLGRGPSRGAVGDVVPLGPPRAFAIRRAPRIRPWHSRDARTPSLWWIACPFGSARAPEVADPRPAYPR